MLLDRGTVLDAGQGPPPQPPPGTRHEHLGGALLAPGPVDLQVNGAGGALFSTATTIDAVHTALRALARTGTAACLPTVFTHPPEQLERALAVLAQTLETPVPPDAARPLGLHLEGPFLNPEKPGCHPRQHLEPPSVDRYRRLRELAGGHLRLLTLAPELPGAPDVIRAAVADGVVVAAGHTLADEPVLQRAADAGLSLVTHLFNAMAPMTTRDPGTVGAALTNHRLTATLIADGTHVHPSVLRVALQTKGPDHLCLVSDAMPPLGTHDPSFSLLGKTITVTEGRCATEDGTLAGSVLPLWHGVMTLHRHCGVALEQAAALATESPARLLGQPPPLTPGTPADVLAMDATGRPRHLWLRGEKVPLI